jgi:2-polyprenyl-6-methoxyphenol hydroxylase-like FAD-dependent oxidoreductase
MKKSKHAVVIGGSLAGMCAARMLLPAFDRVTVLERNELNGSSVPHARQLHVLLGRGRLVFENIFPGFLSRMRALGAHEVDLGSEFASYIAPFGWFPRTAYGIPWLIATRRLLDGLVRELLIKEAAITIRERTPVTGLLVDRMGPDRIVGVAVEDRNSGTTEEISADLVVDTSGQASPALEWLEHIGLEPPPTNVVDPYAGYSSRLYRPGPKTKGRWWKGARIDFRFTPIRRHCWLIPIEGDRWMVTITGMSKRYPPSDEAKFVQALAEFPIPMIADAVQDAEPLTNVASFRSCANRFRRYDLWRSSLAGFVALGDAVCAINPFYGHGMTLIGISAQILRDCVLRYGPGSPDLSQAFFSEQARHLKQAWSLATSVDFGFPATQGCRPFGTRWSVAYSKAVVAVARENDAVRHRFWEVINLLRPKSSLVIGATPFRVAAHMITRRLRQRANGTSGQASSGSSNGPMSGTC